MLGLVVCSSPANPSQSNINANCNTYVFHQPSSGVSLATFAFLEQRAICQCWDVVFSFFLIGVFFLLYIIIVASQVNRAFNI